MRSGDSGRSGDRRIDAAALQIVYISVYRVRFSASRLAGQKHVRPGFENSERVVLGHSETNFTIQSRVAASVPYKTWQKVEATVKNNADGSVTIELFADGKLLVEAIDSGMGGAPISTPGKVGIRGDNANFKFKNFTVTALE